MSRELPYARYDPGRCLNCDAGLAPGARFCPACGQRNRRPRRSVIEWLREGLSAFFHFEGRAVRTLRDLPVPGRVASNYLDGRRERYLHPLRLVLLASLLCLAVVRAVSGGEAGFVDVDFDAGDPDDDAAARAELAAALEDVTEGEALDFDVGDYDSLLVRRLLDSTRAAQHDADAPTRTLAALDSATVELEQTHARRRARRVFGVLEDRKLIAPMRSIDRLRMRFADHDRVAGMVAVAKTRPSARDTAVRALLDSFALAFSEPEGTYLPDYLFFGEATGITTRQYATLAPKEIARASAVESPLNRLLLAKIAQLNQDGTDSVNDALLANVTWAVLLFIPLLAFGYWGLYRRRLPYYSQHLNLVAVTMSAGLLLGTLALVAQALGAPTDVTWGSTAVLFYGYVLATEVRVFRVAWWKALLKGLALGVYGAVAFALAIMLWISITVLAS